MSSPLFKPSSKKHFPFFSSGFFLSLPVISTGCFSICPRRCLLLTQRLLTESLTISLTFLPWLRLTRDRKTDRNIFLSFFLFNIKGKIQHLAQGSNIKHSKAVIKTRQLEYSRLAGCRKKTRPWKSVQAERERQTWVLRSSRGRAAIPPPVPVGEVNPAAGATLACCYQTHVTNLKYYRSPRSNTHVASR